MRVLFFSHVKDAVGLPEMDLAVSGSLDAAGLWTQLIGRYPKLGPFRKTTRLARNGEYAGPDVTFANTDEVALIPPVSGG